MFYDLPCTLPINAQDATFTTYRDIACTLQTNANNDNFYGRLIDCTLPVTTYLVDAATGDIQSIRITITCNGQDVSAALVGEIEIHHMKNACSTFSFYLGDFASYYLAMHNRVDPSPVEVIEWLKGELNK